MIRREIDSPYAWFRLAAATLLSTIGGVGMWSVVVALPAVQADFGSERGAASMPFTAVMMGFGLGSVLMGKLADRVGIVPPVLVGGTSLGLGYILASTSQSLWQFTACYGLLIGLCGSAATFVPLLADISRWFEKRRGIAVSLCASGNYLAGVIWPTLIEAMIRAHGWRATDLAIGIFCIGTMVPLAALLRGPSPMRRAGAPPVPTTDRRAINLPPGPLQILLSIAGVACCVAMAMPQVHIVAYCGDLGYGPARGAQMLSLMLAFGIVSRIGSGFIADRLGGVVTLLLGSAAQMAALSLFLFFNSLASLYVVSALFGLFQGGLIPSYAIIVRESFPASQAGSRVGVILMMTLVGMALGGWMSGAIFDLTGSYRAAFANGVAWNALNFLIALFLLYRTPVGASRLATTRRAGSVAG
jgi:MFS family permease